MFTGLVEGLGTVIESRADGPGRRVVIAPPDVLENPSGGIRDGALQLGESIAVNGCCLTIVDLANDRWAFDVGDESLKRTNLGDLKPGDVVNLERALCATARLGGHFVQGHVDGRGTIADVQRADEWTDLTVSLPESLAKYTIEKGSIAVDGVSLTMVEAAADRFRVMLIPHTLASTTLGRRGIGDAVNLEVDLLAKYIEKLMSSRR